MPAWQLALVLAVQIVGWYLAAHITEQRAVRRDALRAELDRALNDSLQRLFEQRQP